MNECIVINYKKEEKIMNQYERRFYEDIHKLVIIQGKILKQLEEMNKPLQVEELIEESQEEEIEVIE